MMMAMMKVTVWMRHKFNKSRLIGKFQKCILFRFLSYVVLFITGTECQDTAGMMITMTTGMETGAGLMQTLMKTGSSLSMFLSQRRAMTGI